MDLLPYVPVIAFLLAMEGFFSGAEMAIIACDKLRIRGLAAEGGRGARLVEKMLQKPEWLLGTTLVGTNLAEVSNAVLVTLLLISRDPVRGEFLAVLIMSPLILFWGEILPKTFFRQKADFLAPRVVFVLWFAGKVFWPVLWLITVVPRALPWTSGRSSEEQDAVRREDLRILLNLPQNGSDILTEQRKMVDRLIDLSDKKVQEIMIPLIDVVAVPEKADIAEAVRLIGESGHSRLPVFRDRIVQIIGVLRHFDLLLAEERSGAIGPHVCPALYVPETKKVYPLLLQMKKSGNSIAIAVDEYGGATGIITVEDILEEIVGEIEDEHDSKKSLYQRIGPASYLLDARIETDQMNERLGVEIPEGDYETLGGLLMSRMGRIPREGEVLRMGKLTLTVTQATQRAIVQVRLDIL